MRTENVINALVDASIENSRLTPKSRIFVNATNHPSTKWSEEQLNAALEYGPIVDVPFPQVDPNADMDEVNEVINKFLRAILANGKNIVVHIMGESIVTFAVVNSLIKLGIPCVASTTARNVVETVNEDGTTAKNVLFKFVQFRSYLY